MSAVPTETDRKVSLLAARILVLDQDHPATFAVSHEATDSRRMSAAVISLFASILRKALDDDVVDLAAELIDDPVPMGWTFAEEATT